MGTVTLAADDVEKLYQEKIRSMQNEIGNLEAEKNRVQASTDAATKEKVLALADLSKIQQEIETFKETKKSLEADLERSKQTATAHLKKVETQVEARLIKAESAEAKEQSAKSQSGVAYQKVYGLAQDLVKLAKNFSSSAQALSEAVSKEVASYPS